MAKKAKLVELAKAHLEAGEKVHGAIEGAYVESQNSVAGLKRGQALPGH